MSTEQQQIVDALRAIPDAELENPFNAPWRKFPPELVRDDLVRRLKMRSDLTLEAKKEKYKAIIERYRLTVREPSLENILTELVEKEGLYSHLFSNDKQKDNSQTEDVNPHLLQMQEIYSQYEDAFEGKKKPGDWRPEGSELCPSCSGSGKGNESRLCGKCSGRGFIRT